MIISYFSEDAPAMQSPAHRNVLISYFYVYRFRPMALCLNKPFPWMPMTATVALDHPQCQKKEPQTPACSSLRKATSRMVAYKTGQGLDKKDAGVYTEGIIFHTEWS